jgi:hypothetical protein
MVYLFVCALRGGKLGVMLGWKCAAGGAEVSLYTLGVRSWRPCGMWSHVVAALRLFVLTEVVSVRG